MLNIKEFFPFEPTSDQQAAFDSIEEFHIDVFKRNALIIKGYAGTGKTTLIAALVKALESKSINFLLMAPTGRAAKVMSSYSECPASTIHRGIYLFNSGDQSSGFSLKRNLLKNTYVIVDEASMIASAGGIGGSFVQPGQTLLDDLCKFVYNGFNCKLILVGDDAQLPPVHDDKSPALNPEYLHYNFNLNIRTAHLKQVTRQSQLSGILFNANKLRLQIQTDEIDIPEFDCSFDDFNQLQAFDIEDAIQSSFSNEGAEETIVICRSNRDANQLNDYIRFQMLGRESELDAGDRLMVVKNNYFWLQDFENPQFIANGEIIEVQRIGEIEEKYGLRFCNAQCYVQETNIQFEAKLLLTTLKANGPALSKEEFIEFMKELEHEMPNPYNKKERKEFLKTHPYYNALQVKFGYAITCHKSQGGQWNHVYFMQGYFTDEQLDLSYLRWLYTGITRAKTKLYLLNFKKEFFNQEHIEE